MEFFLDTANINDIRAAHSWGVLDGVTTNPSLVAKEGRRDFKQVVQEICEIVQGPVSAECVTTTRDELIAEGRELATWSPHVVVKIPLIPDGIAACRALSEEGIKINVTLCFTAAQALLTMKAGAAYVSPFVGRLEDRNEDGMRVVEDIVQIIDNYGYGTKVIVASIRDTLHVTQAAMVGAHVATMPFAVLRKMFDHPLTTIGLEGFLADWKKLQGEPTG